MSDGYSGTPLTRKLGIAYGMPALLIDVPEGLGVIADHPDFSRVCTAIPHEIERAFDYIHVFARDRAWLTEMAPGLRGSLTPNGMLWVSWPKKASKVRTDLGEDGLRDIFLPMGLVDVKVAAIDATWSGLKFMFRKEIRPTL